MDGYIFKHLQVLRVLSVTGCLLMHLSVVLFLENALTNIQVLLARFLNLGLMQCTQSVASS